VQPREMADFDLNWWNIFIRKLFNIIMCLQFRNNLSSQSLEKNPNITPNRSLREYVYSIKFERTMAG
jgi:hypothetical protein